MKKHLLFIIFVLGLIATNHMVGLKIFFKASKYSLELLIKKLK